MISQFAPTDIGPPHYWDKMPEMPENRKETGVHNRTISCILGAKNNAISSLLAFARLLGSISANK